MQATLLVELDLSPDELLQLEEVSNDILDAVSAAGYMVNSVKPWARPSVTPTNPITP